MTGLLAGLAPAVLAGVLTQISPPPAPPCFPAEAQISAAQSRWLCGQLAAAGKGRLEGPTAYRLVYLPSFRPAKIIEIRQERGGWLIQTTVLGGLGGGPPGEIRERRQRWLTADEELDLAATLKRSNVWQPDVRVPSNEVDGSTLLFEAVQPGTHRVHVVAASARKDQSLYELGELLRAMAGIDDLER
jgi:hypothetical protein